MPGEKGYYISHTLQSNSYGPRASELNRRSLSLPSGVCPLYGASSLQLHIDYGEPVGAAFDQFSPVKKPTRRYSLLLYYDPAEQDYVYVTRFPDNSRTHDDSLTKYAKAYPMDERFARVFTEFYPRWEQEYERYCRENREFFWEGVRKAGVVEPSYPAERSSRREKEEYAEAFRAYYQTAIAHTTPPHPALVEVTGLNDVFENMPVTRRRK